MYCLVNTFLKNDVRTINNFSRTTFTSESLTSVRHAKSDADICLSKLSKKEEVGWKTGSFASSMFCLRHLPLKFSDSELAF